MPSPIFDAGSQASALPQTLEEFVGALDRQWCSLRREFGALQERLETFRENDGFLLCSLGSELSEAKEKLDGRAYEEIQREMAYHFRVTGRTLDLKDDEVRAKFFASHRRRAPKPFTPRAAAEALYAHLAPHATDMAHQQLADAFVEAFGLRHQREVKQQSGCIVLSIRAWIDSFNKANYGRNVYSYQSKDRIRDALTLLSQVWQVLFHESRQEALDVALAAFEAAGWSPGPALKPGFGTLKLRCFQDHVDVYIPEAKAAEINAFLTAHSARLREE